MDYLTQFYKNKVEFLSEKINFLEKKLSLNEDKYGLTPYEQYSYEHGTQTLSPLRFSNLADKQDAEDYGVDVKLNELEKETTVERKQKYKTLSPISPEDNARREKEIEDLKKYKEEQEKQQQKQQEREKDNDDRAYAMSVMELELGDEQPASHSRGIDDSQIKPADAIAPVPSTLFKPKPLVSTIEDQEHEKTLHDMEQYIIDFNKEWDEGKGKEYRERQKAPLLLRKPDPFEIKMEDEYEERRARIDAYNTFLKKPEPEYTKPEIFRYPGATHETSPGSGKWVEKWEDPYSPPPPPPPPPPSDEDIDEIHDTLGIPRRIRFRPFADTTPDPDVVKKDALKSTGPLADPFEVPHGQHPGPYPDIDPEDLDREGNLKPEAEHKYKDGEKERLAGNPLYADHPVADFEQPEFDFDNPHLAIQTKPVKAAKPEEPKTKKETPLVASSPKDLMNKILYGRLAQFAKAPDNKDTAKEATVSEVPEWAPQNFMDYLAKKVPVIGTIKKSKQFSAPKLIIPNQQTNSKISEKDLEDIGISADVFANMSPETQKKWLEYVNVRGGLNKPADPERMEQLEKELGISSSR